MASATHHSKLAGGEIALWRDSGAICLKTTNPFGDPVELSDDEAIGLAETLSRLAGRVR